MSYLKAILYFKNRHMDIQLHPDKPHPCACYSETERVAAFIQGTTRRPAIMRPVVTKIPRSKANGLKDPETVFMLDSKKTFEKQWLSEIGYLPEKKIGVINDENLNQILTMIRKHIESLEAP